MHFEYFAPSAPLAGLVAFHYGLDTADTGADAGLCALLGQVQVIVGGRVEYRFGHHYSRAIAGANLIGPTDSAGRLQGAAGTTIIGCGLTPAGWHALTGGRLLTNALMPLPFADAERMTAMVSMAADTRSMVATVDGWLVAHLAGAAPDARIASIDAWIIDDGIAYIDDLAGALSLSRRALERLTLRTHGATPKRLSAKYRALKAAGRLAVGEVNDWRAAAAPGQFADQAHFIRDFRRYVGVTPGQFMADESLFVRRLIRGQWAPGREIGISIWA